MNERRDPSPEVERRLERYLEDLARGEPVDLDALGATLAPEERLELRLHATAQEYLFRRGEGGPVDLDDYLGRFEASERERFLRLVGDADAARQALPGELAPGAVLDDRFEILREIGRGGMGTVYAALDRELEREVALKTVRDPGSPSADWAESLQLESRTLARLESKNIVSIHDVRRGDARSYIVMDLVRGTDLRRVLDQVAEERRVGRLASRSPVPLRRAVGRSRGGERSDLLGHPTHARCVAAVLRDVAATLERAHEAGVVHRDIKPPNVMLLPGGEPVLLDFGLASLAGRPDAGFRGTPEYLAPEQVASLRSGQDPRTDVYQVGLLAYECLTLSCAFPTRPDEPLSGLFERICEGRHRPLSHAEPAPPRALARIVERAMAGDPDDRYPSMRALREDLDRFVARRPPRHVAVGPALRAGMWIDHLARRPVAAIALAALLTWGYVASRSAPWVPPALGVILAEDASVVPLETGQPIAFRDACVLGLEARVESDSFLYAFSIFGAAPKAGGLSLRPIELVPWEAYATGTVGEPDARLGSGTHRLACAMLRDPSPYEGLLVFACERPNATLARWCESIEEVERSRGGPVSYEEALDLGGRLGLSVRGEALGALPEEERQRIFGAVLAAERGDERALAEVGIRRYRFVFPVERVAQIPSEVR